MGSVTCAAVRNGYIAATATIATRTVSAIPSAERPPIAGVAVPARADPSSRRHAADEREALADVVRLASIVCDTPAAALALIDGERFRFKARVGLEATGVARQHALSEFAMRQPGRLFMVEDIAAEARFDNFRVRVGDARAQFYAGLAVCDRNGHAIGALCVYDATPRVLSPRQQEGLIIVARQAQRLLEHDRSARERQRELSEHQSMARTLEHRATHDRLTGLLNRDALAQLRIDPVALARLQAAPYCLMLLDIDHFKQVNDRHGHLLGDRALREVALAVAATVRETDVAVRFGGEEFLVVLPQTALANAAEIAERIRQNVAAMVLPFRLTLSAGVAAGDPERDQPEEVFARADQALYRAKATGRDRVVADDTMRLND